MTWGVVTGVVVDEMVGVVDKFRSASSCLGAPVECAGTEARGPSCWADGNWVLAVTCLPWPTPLPIDDFCSDGNGLGFTEGSNFRRVYNGTITVWFVVI